MLDGKITVPDEKGVTHIDRLSEALRRRLAYFAFASPVKPPTRGASTSK